MQDKDEKIRMIKAAHMAVLEDLRGVSPALLAEAGLTEEDRDVLLDSNYQYGFYAGTDYLAVGFTPDHQNKKMNVGLFCGRKQLPYHEEAIKTAVRHEMGHVIDAYRIDFKGSEAKQKAHNIANKYENIVGRFSFTAACLATWGAEEVIDKVGTAMLNQPYDSPFMLSAFVGVMGLRLLNSTKLAQERSADRTANILSPCKVSDSMDILRGHDPFTENKKTMGLDRVTQGVKATLYNVKRFVLYPNHPLPLWRQYQSWRDHRDRERVLMQEQQGASLPNAAPMPA